MKSEKIELLPGDLALRAKIRWRQDADRARPQVIGLECVEVLELAAGDRVRWTNYKRGRSGARFESISPRGELIALSSFSGAAVKCPAAPIVAKSASALQARGAGISL